MKPQLPPISQGNKMKMNRWYIFKSPKHICFTFTRNYLKYVIKRIGDQSDDKGYENDVERNDEENKNAVEKLRQEESFSSRLIKTVFCLM